MTYQVFRVNCSNRYFLEKETDNKQDAINYIHARYYQQHHFYEIGSYSEDMWVLKERSW